MRATVDGIEIEGTPEEIAEFVATIRSQRTPPVSVEDRNSEISNNTSSLEATDGGITEKFAYRTLRRLPLSAFQKELLKTLRDAHPGWVLSSNLQTALDCSPTQLGGVFGGLGRRVTATKGYETGFDLWEWKWDDDEGEYAYRLPSNTISALDRVIS
ncbi:MAG: hypothetical protein R3D89_03685 [Sphingomonadaceae bacterium]